MSRVPVVRRVTGRELRKLVSDESSRLDAELSRELSFPAYHRPGGAVLLVITDRRGGLFESLEDLLRFHAEGKALQARGPLHVLTDRLPQRSTFVEQVPTLLAHAPSLLGIDPAKLDRSPKSLSMIDRVVRKRGAERILAPDVFPVLVAYIGEVMREVANGRWELVHVPAHDVWEPWIVGTDGHAYPAFAFVRELFEWNRQSSIAGFVRGQLDSSPFRLARPSE